MIFSLQKQYITLFVRSAVKIAVIRSILGRKYLTGIMGAYVSAAEITSGIVMTGIMNAVICSEYSLIAYFYGKCIIRTNDNCIEKRGYKPL